MFNYLMGRQMVGECLSLWKEFINGHMLMICKGAEDGVSQSTLHNVRQRGLTSYPQAMQGQGVGGWGRSPLP